MKQLSMSFRDLYPLMEQAFRDGGQVQLTIRGSSMQPFLTEGRDAAVFAAPGKAPVRRGDLLFYQRANGQFVMHRVYDVDQNGVMTLLGDAQWTLEKGVCAHQIRASVPYVVRKGKKISCEKGFYRLLMTLWMLRIHFPRLAKGVLFLRRAWLYVKKRIRRLIGCA